MRSSKARAHRADQVGLVHRSSWPRAFRASRAFPSHWGWGSPPAPSTRAGNAPKPISVQVTGKRSDVANSTSSSAGVRVDHAAARVDHGTLRGRRAPWPPGESASDCPRASADSRAGARRRPARRGSRRVRGPAGCPPTRAGASGAGHVEGLVDRARDFQRVLDHEGVLDDRHRDPDRVGLLEAIGAEQLGAHLAGDEHDRHRVHHRVADRRDQVGRAGTARGERHADLAGRLGVALGGVAAAGLVTHEDVTDATVHEGVVGREIGATGQAEDDIHALRLQAFHHRVDRTHLHRPPFLRL